MSLFIAEGGVAGHMNHLYDNPDLTFREMKQVFQAARTVVWMLLVLLPNSVDEGL